MNHPINSIEWVDSNDLVANSWNPNVVFNRELKLLEESILLTGWIHPIIINRNNMIIDGFHRSWLARTSKKLDSSVPCVRLDIDDREAMMMTVRINRAKGTHSALRMRDLVQTLVDEFSVTPEEMIQKMGMTASEVDLLYDGSLLKKRELQNQKYSKAWVPIETRLEQEVEYERDADDS